MDKSSGVANVIRDENRISASPNPAVHGTPVVITVPNGSTGSRAISVTSLNGTHIYSRTINPDADRISIPTQGFTPGMYIFTLTENGRNIESCKIIIR
ncbi:T9SS type A sorting domain-containing protein [Muribaculum intestinale]|nr:T9SS type A sorting domain-containing protein [Muribaculum intestinale]